MNESYLAPQSDLVEKNSSSDSTLEDGLSGNYTINISNVISEAWGKTKGVKRYILGAAVLMYVGIFVAIMLLALLGTEGAEPGLGFILIQIVTQLLMMTISVPFFAGMMLLAMKKVQGQPFDFGDILSGFRKIAPLVIAGALMNVFIIVGFVFLIIPGLYLSFAYMLTLPLIIDRDMGVWEAMETSRKAITKHWFSFFGFWLVMMLIFLVAMIPFGLGLIWVAPMFILAYVIVYREVFGIESV